MRVWDFSRNVIFNLVYLRFKTWFNMFYLWYYFIKFTWNLRIIGCFIWSIYLWISRKCPTIFTYLIISIQIELTIILWSNFGILKTTTLSLSNFTQNIVNLFRPHFLILYDILQCFLSLDQPHHIIVQLIIISIIGIGLRIWVDWHIVYIINIFCQSVI